MKTVVFDLNNPVKFRVVTTRFLPDYIRYGGMNIIGLSGQNEKEAISSFFNMWNLAFDFEGLHFVDFQFKGQCTSWIIRHKAYLELSYMDSFGRMYFKKG